MARMKAKPQKPQQAKAAAKAAIKTPSVRTTTPRNSTKAARVANGPVSRSKDMNEQFTRQAQDMFNAAQGARIPENIQAMAEDGVAKTREAYAKINVVTKDGARAVEEVILATQAGAKALGDKMMQNTASNTEAVFDAAQAIARARSLPEAARLQADFMQQQMAMASAQTKEFFELSTKVTREALETMNSAASKSFEQMKR